MVQPFPNQQFQAYSLRPNTNLWILPEYKAVFGVQRRKNFRRGLGVAAALLSMLVVAVGVIVLARTVVRAALSGPVAGAATPLTVKMTVGQGDSLWSIASRYGNPDDNIQERMDILAHANGTISGTGLVVGQRLLVPVGNPMELARLKTSVASAR